jgi:acyl-CoA synthetase (AMP-forming)/AMP-acid ligase II
MALTDSIAAHARSGPDRTAVIFNGGRVSYGAFAGRIARTRAALLGAGLRPGRLAVVCVHHLLQSWIVGLALRGAGITTVNAKSAEDALQLSGPGGLLVASAGEAHLWSDLPAMASAAGLPLAIVPPELFEGDAPSDEPPPSVPPGAHILLTSGTTGLSKKVLLDAAAEADLVAFNTHRCGVSADTVFNLMDFGLWTGASYTWPALTWSAGGVIVFNVGRERWRPFAETALTHAVVTPHMLDELLATPPGSLPRNEGLTLLTVGGVIARDPWRGMRARMGAAMLCLYGATETCHMTFTPIEREADLQGHRIHDDIIQVVDEDDRPLPAGQVGLVRLKASRGEAGYLDDEATSRAFFKGGWFYPGDLGIIEAERLFLQGRVTDVINVKGGKLATIPIETALQDALGARAVCVFSVPTPDGEAVHVAIQPGEAITPAALRAALKAALPRMPNVRVHRVDGLPRNHMGKVDRAALKRALVDEAPTS